VTTDAKTQDLEAELAIADELREKMASTLTRSVNAIRGEPGLLCRHSWHDLPELIDSVNVDLLEALLDKAKADETITRLKGEARVMLDLLQLSVGVMETIVPDDCDSTQELDKLIDAIRAVLSERLIA